jgi:2-dehydro-3-deoxyphosphooctonate aldolase (KDO 8-P synthase)
MAARVDIGEIPIGPGLPLVLIAGPDVIESRDLVLQTAERLQSACATIGAPLIFKASFDKANRTSIDSFRGPGLEAGLEVLREVKDSLGLPLTTDVHETAQVGAVAEVVDLIQIPAFLCRQTDLLRAAANSGCAVNVKKGQFVAPPDTVHIAQKLRDSGCERILLTERGSSFGYNNLVVDMRSIPWMREATGCPVVFDATSDGQSGGTRDFIPHLARAAVAAGSDAVFMEVHPDPATAKCDAAVSWPLDRLESLLRTLSEIRQLLLEQTP